MEHQEAATVWPLKLYLPTLAKAGLVIKRAVSKSSHHPGLETVLTCPLRVKVARVSVTVKRRKSIARIE